MSKTTTQFADSGFLTADTLSQSNGLEYAQLLRVLDEIDYGLMVIDPTGRLCHINHLARAELASARMILVQGNHLAGCTAELSHQIQEALEHSSRGQRRLVFLSQGGRELSLAFIPLSNRFETDHPQTLVLLSRQSACDNLAVRMFARSQSLSPTEESVLMHLCSGMEIPQIAKHNKVAESTVRSQIKALREKTGCSSIRQLLLRVNSLPPVVPALRFISPVSSSSVDFSHS